MSMRATYELTVKSGIAMNAERLQESGCETNCQNKTKPLRCGYTTCLTTTQLCAAKPNFIVLCGSTDLDPSTRNHAATRIEAFIEPCGLTKQYVS